MGSNREQLDESTTDNKNYVAGYFVPADAVLQEQQVDLRSLLQALIDQRWLIAAIVIGITAATVVVVLLLTPIYRAEVLLSPVVEKSSGGGLAALASQFGGLASLAGIDLGGQQNKEEAVAVMSSRAFTDEFIRDENLMPILFHDDWDATNKKWDVDDPEDIPTAREAFRYFDENVRSISEDRKTGLVTLAIEWEDRELAARWANLLAGRINEALRAEAIAEAEKSMEFLNAELDKSSVMEMRQVIFRLIEAQTQTIMLANTRDEYAFRVLDPAVPPDEKDKIKPRRRVIVVAMFLLSSAIAVFAAFIASAMSKSPKLAE